MRNEILLRKVRTRFAPSPTGMMHIGGVRTALYEFLVAKKNNGIFTLRIEDTDRKRFVPGSVEDIIENLKWLGLNFDEGPIYQSERKEIYLKYAKDLISKGVAYEKEGAIWFKVPNEGKVVFEDLIGNRKIEFENSSQKDFVLIKSDGYPTYHFAHVVDDYLMKTNPVIRGEEWLSSTPKHIMLFKAFGWDVPSYAHLPLILGPDRSKLSKRHGARSVTEFRKKGFLKDAILNYIALLGWTPSSGKEVFSLQEMIEEFSLRDVHTTPAIFDIQKLEWMNGIYIRKSQISNLKSQIYEFYDKEYSEEIIKKTVPLVKERIKKLSDYLPLCEFFFREPENYDVDISSKKEIFQKTAEILSTLDKWKAKFIGEKMQKTAKDLGVKNSEYFMLARVAITGKKISPPLNESMEILGREEVIKRLEKVSNL